MTTPQPHRTIRSFVMRAGRITPGQERALAEYWPRFGLDADGQTLHPTRIFSRTAPLVFEIGFGMGDSLLTMAQQEPDKDFIGVEVHLPGVGRLLNQIGQSGLSNLRVMQEDAVTILREQVPAGSLARLQIYFPDPWHKKKHHKRRLIQPGFLDLAADRLAPGGELHLATDWAHYAEHMHQVLATHPAFDNVYAPAAYAPEPPHGRPATKFEQRGRGKGHNVWDLLYQRR